MEIKPTQVEVRRLCDGIVGRELAGRLFARGYVIED